MKEKICSQCGFPKSFDEFYDNPSAKDGKFTECITCVAENRRQHQREIKVPGHPRYHKSCTAIQDRFAFNAF